MFKKFHSTNFLKKFCEFIFKGRWKSNILWDLFLQILVKSTKSITLIQASKNYSLNLEQASIGCPNFIEQSKAQNIGCYV